MKTSHIILISIIVSLVILIPTNSFSSEINTGRGIALQNEIGEWTYYDKLSGYTVKLPRDWEYTIETDFRTRDLVMIQSTDKTTERFKPYLYITDSKNSLVSSSPDFLSKGGEPNEEKFLEEFILKTNSTGMMSEIIITSFEKQSFLEMHIFDISGEIRYKQLLAPLKFEKRTIYFDGGDFFELGLLSGVSDFENHVIDFRNSIETFDIGYSNLQLLSPLKQTQEGLPPKAVSCKDHMKLYLKSSDGKPVCLKHPSDKKLIERGWTSRDLRVK